MKKVNCFDEYKSLISNEKIKCRRLNINYFLSKEEVEEYIRDGRLFYINVECGLMFLLDEIKYFKTSHYFNPEIPLKLDPLEKPLLLRTYYRDNNKIEILQKFEIQLEDAGFHLYSQALQILVKPFDFKATVDKKLERMIERLKQGGFSLVYAKVENIADIIKLMEETSEFKEFDLDYESDEKMRFNIENGYIRCILDNAGNVCAAQEFGIKDNMILGNWMAVKKEYQVHYGMGVALAYHSLRYAIEHEYTDYYGWVDKNNDKSIRYHEAIGYKLTGRVADAWVLPSINKKSYFKLMPVSTGGME